MKKIIVAVTILSMLTLVGCGNSTGDKKTSESTKTEEQFQKEAKKREEDAKRKQELVHSTIVYQLYDKFIPRGISISLAKSVHWSSQ